MKSLKFLLLFVLCLPAFGQGQFGGGGGGGGLPSPTAGSQCLVSTGAGAGQFTWGACSGTTNSNFSTLTPDTTNATTGTFAAGANNTWDFSAAAVIKTKVAAGYAPTVDGQFGVNSTTHLPVFGSNGGTLIWPANTTATLHQFFTAFNNATGVFTKAQPACADISDAVGGCTMSTTGAGDISGTLPNVNVVATHLSAALPVNQGGTGTISTLTGLVRGSAGAMTAAELSGDVTTSGSNAATVVKANGNSIPSGAAAHQVLVGTAANTFSLKTLNDCTGGASALSFAQSGDAFGCLASILTGTLTSGRVSFSNGTNSLTDSANLLFAASSGFTQIQGANNTDAHYIKRFTDTSPTGNFLRFQDAAALNDLFKVDILGNVTGTSFSSSNAAGNAGQMSLVQGTAPSAVANAVNFLAPTSVTTYTVTFPGTVAAGFWNQTAGGALSFGALTGDASSSGLTVTNTKVNGVSYPASPSNDTTPIITASNTATYTAIPTCAADATHAEQYNSTTHTWACAAITATASPSAPTTSVQFNNGGALGGSANLTWVSPVLTIGAAGVTGQLSVAGSSSGATAIQSAATASGTLTLPAATDTLVGKATTDTFTNKTINASNNTILNITGAMMTSATVTATQLAAQYSKGACSVGWWGSGTSNAMTSGDDNGARNACYNDSGVTRTITAVKCRSDNAANTTTVNPTFGSDGTGTTILSGALTCGNSYAYSSSGTVSNSGWTTGTGIAAGLTTLGNAQNIAMIVEYTY